MKATIYGSFIDPDHAERAAGALMDHGLHDYDLTLLIHERDLDKDTDEARRQQNELESHQLGDPKGGYAYADTPGRFIKGPDDGLNVPGRTGVHEELMAGANQPDATTYNIPPKHLDDGENLQRTDLVAKSGLSTTTAGDAGSGAVQGAAVGLGVGVLAAMAAIFVPGVGLVAGAGALATAIAGTVGAAGAGAITGGAVGFLKDQGVPDEALTVYREAYSAGGAILAVNLPEKVDRFEIEAVLAKYGAQNVDMYGQN
jgi:hypothetical protein